MPRTSLYRGLLYSGSTVQKTDLEGNSQNYCIVHSSDPSIHRGSCAASIYPLPNYKGYGHLSFAYNVAPL